MKILSFFIKTWKENIREWKILVLALILAPMFVYLMYAYWEGSSTSSYIVAVLNLDSEGIYSRELILQWRELADAEGEPILEVIPVDGEEAGRKMVRDRTADLLIRIPPDFSSSFSTYIIEKKGEISSLISYGDPANGKYMMAASYCDYRTFAYLGERTGQDIPLNIEFESTGETARHSEFDLYFPALLVFSLIMILFTAAATLIREVEKGTMRRLLLSDLKPWEMITAVSFNQVIIGTACLVLTYCAGLSVGYRSSGSLELLFLIGAVTSFSVIAISIITASFINTLFGLLTVGCFPFFILMFFSDCFMPLPKFQIISLRGNPIFLNDILPTAIATRAFNKVLNYNADFAQISFEFFLIVVLSLIYFFIGITLFWRKHMIMRRN